MPNTDITNQATHMARLKNIFNQAVIFMHKKCIAVGCHNPCSILPTMLQHQQTIVQQLVNWIFTNNAYNSTHE